MSVLNQVTTGKRVKPPAVLLHGIHGIGKSTFGAKSKDPIFVGPEENDELVVPRLPKVTSWNQLTDQLKALRDEKHDYKTLVLDTVDTLEQVAQKEILKDKNAGKTMATAMGGFGKAYEKQRDMFLDIRDNYIVPMRENGMAVIILAHSERCTIEDPMTNVAYTKWETAIHKKCKPVFEDWVSAILFATYENYKSERADGKEIAVGDGERIIYTEERPSHIAKNRYNLEYEFELKYSEFSKQFKDFYKGAKKSETKKEEVKEELDAVAELKYQIEHQMSNFSGDQLTKINTAYKRAGEDEEKLKKVLKRIEKTLL